LGRIGLVLTPLEDGEVYADPARTLEALGKGVDLAASLGAQTVSLTGLIPSATSYGRALATARTGLPGPRLATGHGTPSARVVMMEKMRGEGGLGVEEQSVGVLGLGSIGTGILRLLLAQLPRPRRLMLFDLPAKAGELARLGDELRARYGFGDQLVVRTATDT